MKNARPFRDICCMTQAILFNSCLSQADLEALDAWKDHPSRHGFSPSVWCRAFLHRACNGSEEAARRVTDHLDLKFVDDVLLVRMLEQDELATLVRGWIAKPRGEALPGLLWSLCTDPRDDVHALGVRLAHESVCAAFKSLVGEEVTAPGA